MIARGFGERLISDQSGAVQGQMLHRFWMTAGLRAAGLMLLIY